MGELLELSVSPVNLPFTILLSLVVLYWVGVILGALDLDLFDFDLGGDADVDVDVDVDASADVEADVDADAHTSAGGLGGGMLATLKFFHVGCVPLMVLVSFLALSLWVISIVGNYYLGEGSVLVALLLLVPNIAVSLVVTKVLTLPLRSLFRRLEEQGGGTVEALGQRCVVRTTKVDDRTGQAEVKTDAAPLVLTVHTRAGAELHRGDEAVVVEYDKNKRSWLIAKL